MVYGMYEHYGRVSFFSTFTFYKNSKYFDRLGFDFICQSNILKKGNRVQVFTLLINTPNFFEFHSKLSKFSVPALHNKMVKVDIEYW